MWWRVSIGQLAHDLAKGRGGRSLKRVGARAAVEIYVQHTLSKPCALAITAYTRMLVWTTYKLPARPARNGKAATKPDRQRPSRRLSWTPGSKARVGEYLLSPSTCCGCSSNRETDMSHPCFGERTEMCCPRVRLSHRCACARVPES